MCRFKLIPRLLFGSPRGRVARWMLVLLSSVSVAQGADLAGEFGTVSWRVLAPDVVRRGERWNVLVLLSRTQVTGEAAPIHLRWIETRGVVEGLEASGMEPSWAEVKLATTSEGMARHAFRGLRVASEVEVDFVTPKIVIDVAGTVEEIPLRIATVRGPVLPRGAWSILVPALMSLLVVPIFVALVRRHGRPGAWRVVREHASEQLPEGRARDDELEPWSARLPGLGLRALFGVGAGALVASFFIGTGDIAIATEMGARSGFSMWWTFFALGIAGWALMDMSVRYWLRFGRTPLGLFKEVHPLCAVYLFLTVCVTTTLGAYSQWNACAQVLTELWPDVPPELAGGISAGAAFAVLSIGVYRRFEAVLVLGLVALIVLFALAAVRAGAPWGDAIAGLVPTVPTEGRESWMDLVQKNAGSMINAWLILVYPYTMLEKGWYSSRVTEKARLLQRSRWDYGFGIAAAGIVALPIIAASTAVARPFGIVPESPTDFAALLEPLAGSSSRVVFLAGLFLAAWTAGIGWIVCGAYAILDFGNLDLRMGSKPFRRALVVFLVASSSILFLRVQPIYGIKIFTVLLAVVFPVVAIVLVWRVSRSDMGYFRWWPRSVRGVLVASLDVLALGVSLLVGWGLLLRVF